ncbi:hypothetical protein G7Y79_00002g007800 [Physcia stellaris]|nr:hypothetical protein G7Y79_00002g007800 [Physcia stellaris]
MFLPNQQNHRKPSPSLPLPHLPSPFTPSLPFPSQNHPPNAPSQTCGYYDLNCDCSPPFRSLTAACEAVSCTPADYNSTQLLADTFCHSLYAANSISAASVTSAIAAATASALAIVAGKDVTSVEAYPICAQGCQKIALADSGGVREGELWGGG